MLVQLQVHSLGADAATDTPILYLQETTGQRVLPIWIGRPEATAIAVRLADRTFGRPLTHDLLARVILGFGGQLSRVILRRGPDNLYLADMLLVRGDVEFTVDARPSDAIAVALRMEAPIFAGDELLPPAEAAATS